MKYCNIIKFIAVLILFSASNGDAKPPVMTVALLTAPEDDLNGWRVVGAEEAIELCLRLEDNGRHFSEPYPFTKRPVLLTLVNAEFLKGLPVEYPRNGTWKVYKYGIIAEHRTIEFYLVKRAVPDYEIPDARALKETHARAKYRHGMSILENPRSRYAEWTEAYCHLGYAADAGHIEAAYQTSLLLRDRLQIEPQNVRKYLGIATQGGHADAAREYHAMYGTVEAMVESPLEGNVLRGALLADVFRFAPGLTREEAERTIDEMMNGVQPMDVEESEPDAVAMEVDVPAPSPVAMDVEAEEPDPVATIVRAAVPRAVRFNVPGRGCN